jgi:hypothetical protein
MISAIILGYILVGEAIAIVAATLGVIEDHCRRRVRTYDRWDAVRVWLLIVAVWPLFLYSWVKI